MNFDELHTIAKKIVSSAKGILAAGEPTGTLQKRFDRIGLENTEDNRRAYRELLFRASASAASLTHRFFVMQTIRFLLTHN